VWELLKVLNLVLMCSITNTAHLLFASHRREPSGCRLRLRRCIFMFICCRQA